MSWILSFGDEAVFLSPEILVDRVSEKIENMKKLYRDTSG
jgi:hypothetical protein